MRDCVCAVPTGRRLASTGEGVVQAGNAGRYRIVAVIGVERRRLESKRRTLQSVDVRGPLCARAVNDSVVSLLRQHVIREGVPPLPAKLLRREAGEIAVAGKGALARYG